MASKDKTAEQVAAEQVADAKVSQKELDSARKDGVLEAAREDAKASYKFLTDGALPGESDGQRFLGKDEIMPFAPIIDLGLDAFKERISEKADSPLPDDKVAGLLELERSGKNRTDYVKALCSRLGVDSPYEVTTAGPGYTNDVQPVTEL